MVRALFVLLAVVFSAATAGGGAAPFRQETVRVAIVKGDDEVRVDGDGLLATDQSGEPVRFALPAPVRRAGDALSVGGRVLRRLTVASPSTVTVNGKRYRGVIELVPADKGVLVINELPLEDYLVGLINCEISSQWPMESVKAQAVVARTYAVYQKRARAGAVYHLESTVLDQVYGGCEIEDSRAARGVRETAGEILTWGGQPIQAFYHSNCGGRTEVSENVWGFRLPYLKSVDCTYCSDTPPIRWEQTLSLKKLEPLLRGAGIAVSGLRDIREGARNNSGRLTELVLVSSRGNTAVPAVTFRKIVGYTVIKSTNFLVRVRGDEAVFTGMGYGHGVGLCQWGAKQRAASGFSYREILSYYFPEAVLTRMDDGQGSDARH
ncbi:MULTISPECIES: SpoIID/LytB domain-containing protein [Geobacter]|uniref:Cell division protein n=2 Tax=Geobacter TaxID=28231 RepID=A0A0C1U180_9BACT|nr:MULTISPECIES: SpoIID/LytB domain-containing protein [Geobacter]ANA39734.1 cell division protein [Geobacter anodireducens]KIE41525.1 cell division protein [Geobacter soli]MBE2888124.1 SpoIID/LytB domain-containing protein [Geobacter anodireducens]HMN02250.1 SpoIID/LytB domain-containing protein [Geobacter anodireducens]